MNTKVYESILLIIGLTAFFSACNSDDKPAPTDGTANQWIEGKMRSMYYWYNEIPDKSKLNFNKETESFFTSLLSDKDGKSSENGHHYYSYIEKTNSTSKSYYGDQPSLGFEFQLWYIESMQKYAVNILYTLPDSPASENGLKRNDWILTIDNSAVDLTNVSKLISGVPVSLGISDEAENQVLNTVTLNPAMVLDNPVYLDTIYNTSNFSNPEIPKDIKIGYLVYNHFTSGPNGVNDETFNNSLRRTFAKFKAGNVDDFILDLRYNMGGIVTSAQLLATMLAPASGLNNEFCHLQYNDKQSSLNRTLKLDTKYMKQGANGENLNLGRLFIITSNRTASASEAVINGLKPYMGDNIILVGEQTEGKNVGSITITDSRYNYKLHPIVCQLYNKNNESDYTNGFSPVEKERREGDNDKELHELGNIDDYLLFITMQYVLFGQVISETNTKAVSDSDRTPIYSSLDSKRVNGVIIPQSTEKSN